MLERHRFALQRLECCPPNNDSLLESFFAACTGFQSKFSEEAFQKQQEEVLKEEALFKEELGKLRHRKLQCQARLKELASQSAAQHKQADEQQSLNAGFRSFECAELSQFTRE